jgi:hypothetical protein
LQFKAYLSLWWHLKLVQEQHLSLTVFEIFRSVCEHAWTETRNLWLDETTY